MDGQFLSLEEMIHLLCRDKKMQICIHDVEGVLSLPLLRLPSVFRIHASRFCDLAKSTTRGNNLCMRCKTRANKAALEKKQPFRGYCPYGLYELAHPVVMDGMVVCIIYIGNLLPDHEEALRRLNYTSSLTGADREGLHRELYRTQPAALMTPYEQIAKALDSYIRLLLSGSDWTKQKKAHPDCQRKAREIAEYILVNYSQNLSLKQLADLYFVNEKYLGKIFQAETGETMRQYLNRVRLNNAARLLRNSDLSVLNIAMDCGFQNVPYFNRTFMGKYQMTPLQYRKEYSGRPEKEAVNKEKIIP